MRTGISLVSVVQLVNAFVRCVLFLQSEGHRFEPDTKPFLLLFMFSLNNNNYKPNNFKPMNDVLLVFFIVIVFIYSQRKLNVSCLDN